MSYETGFAGVYDRIISRQVDFEEYCQRLSDIVKKQGIDCKNVLDLGCGSGLFTEQLCKVYDNVTAVDISEDMLTLALSRLPDNCRLICQDISALSLSEQFDAVFSTMDTFNHITDKKLFDRAIAKTAKHIEDGGVFIFDVNTVHKHRNVLADNTFVFEDEDYFLVWQNFTRADTTSISIDVFLESDGVYQRFYEDFAERAYDDKYIKDTLTKYDFDIVGVHDFESFGRVRKNSEKLIYVTKKKGN